MYAFTNLNNYTEVSNTVYFKQQKTRKIKHITYLHLKGAWIRGIRFGKNTKSRYLNPVLVPNVIEDGSQLSLGVSKNDEQKEWMQEERQVGCFLPFISPLPSWKWCLGTCNTAWCSSSCLVEPTGSLSNLSVTRLVSASSKHAEFWV